MNAADRPILLSKIAARLQCTGNDRERSARRCFRKHGVPLMQRDRKFFATERHFAQLMVMDGSAKFERMAFRPDAEDRLWRPRRSISASNRFGS